MTFDKALEFIFREEGIHANDPQDPGGDTWFGISRKANPDLAWPPTREQAVERYRRNYWAACKCDNFPWEVALVVFDTAVQHSPDDAIRMLQAALKIPVDGVVGAITIRAAWKATHAQLIDVLVARALHYAEQKGITHFGRGWMRRLFHLHSEIAKGLA